MTISVVIFKLCLLRAVYMLKAFLKKRKTNKNNSLLTILVIATGVIVLFLYSPWNQNISVTNAILFSFLSPFKSVNNLHISYPDVLGNWSHQWKNTPWFNTVVLASHLTLNKWQNDYWGLKVSSNASPPWSLPPSTTYCLVPSAPIKQTSLMVLK